MEIIKVTENKEKFMDLLLLGDEQESMIKKYLERGELFALYDDDLKTVSVVTEENNETYEIKNIATYETCQGSGYGSAMIQYIIDNYKNKGKELLVGTGEDERILSFYKKFGFAYSHKIDNFFTENYDHKIFENGKQLIDMIYLKMEFQNKKNG
jgi:GNAT superfamily N-acetyltransferase